MSIEQKLLNITAAVAPLGKTAYNELSKFAFTPEADVKNYIRPFLVNEGLLLTYSTIECSEATGHAKVILEYCFTDVITKEQFRGRWEGSAFNHSGYAVAMAITSATKQHILTTFHIPTYDDPEKVGVKPEDPPIKAESGAHLQTSPGAEMPPIVDEKKLEVPTETVPGNTRKARSSKKALASVENIAEKTAGSPPSDESHAAGYDGSDKAASNGRDWKGGPEELPQRPSYQLDLAVPAIETSPAPAVKESRYKLVDITHMLPGLADGSLMAITKSDSTLVPMDKDVYYAFKLNAVSMEQETIYAVKA